MKTWTIKKRIIVGFSTILTLVAVLAVSAFIELRKVTSEVDFMDRDELPGMRAMSAIMDNVDEIGMNVQRVALSKSDQERKAIQNTIATSREKALKLVDDYEKTITLAEHREMLKQLIVARDAYVAASAGYFDLCNASKLDEAVAYNNATLQPLFDSYEACVSKLLNYNFDNGDKSSARTRSACKQAIAFVGSLSVASIIIGIVFAGVIVIGLNRVLNRVAGSLGDGSNQVSSAATQVSSSSQSLAEGASEQAASLEETGASLEEMSTMTKHNAENAKKASEFAKQARDAADTGATDMQQMNGAMAEIKTSSDDIAKIIKTIDEIAFQTNILALNAAVEAARAGEAGMGFAVVADEVRNLAQRSAQAAKETAAKIEGAIGKTAQGVHISAKVSEALNQIVSKIRQVDELVAEVANASSEQTQGIAQINTAIGQMDKVTQGNAASAEEGAAAAEELSAQSQLMNESVAELMKLINGGDSHITGSGAAAASVATPARSVTPAKTPTSARHTNYSHAPAPARNVAATVSASRSEIPMNGDFKDF